MRCCMLLAGIYQCLLILADDLIEYDFGHMDISLPFMKYLFQPAGGGIFRYVGPFDPIIQVDDPKLRDIIGKRLVELPCGFVQIQVFFVRPVTPPLEHEPTGEVFIIGFCCNQRIDLVLIFITPKLDA